MSQTPRLDQLQQPDAFLRRHLGPDAREEQAMLDTLGLASREALIERFLRLDIDGCLTLLDEIFPITPDPTLGLNFGEPAGPRDVGTYEAEHKTLFEPIRRSFQRVREISGMIQHEVGAFG